MSFDRRLTPARPDLAADHLKGQVEAAKFVKGVKRICNLPAAPLSLEPKADRPLDSQLIYGEVFTAYEEANGWSWGQSESDGYVGYVPSAAFTDSAPEPTHVISALTTHGYPAPDIKARPDSALPFGARVKVKKLAGDFALLTLGRYVPKAHLTKIGSIEPDYVGTATSFFGVPYLWGGRTVGGLDCSGLVQIALSAAGIPTPRDSDMQEAAFEQIPASRAKRGDLVFWKGHVGILTAKNRVLHANAHHMAVAKEPLDETRRRIQAQGGGAVTSFRRPINRDG